MIYTCLITHLISLPSDEKLYDSIKNYANWPKYFVRILYKISKLIDGTDRDDVEFLRLQLNELIFKLICGYSTTNDVILDKKVETIYYMFLENTKFNQNLDVDRFLQIDSNIELSSILLCALNLILNWGEHLFDLHEIYLNWLVYEHLATEERQCSIVKLVSKYNQNTTFLRIDFLSY